MVSELLELSGVIGDIYDAAIHPELWHQTLANICNYAGGYAAVLFWRDSATQQADALHLFNDNPAYTKLYFEKYLPMDPFFPASSFIEAGVIHRSNDVVPQAELEQTRFYQEWIKPQGIVDAIAVNLEKGETRSSFLVIRTDATYGMADASMYERVAAIIPHLQRAVRIGRLFDQGVAEAKDRVLTEALGHVDSAAFLVGADGAIQFFNDAGRKMLDVSDLVCGREGALHAVAMEADVPLQQLFRSIGRGDAPIEIAGIPLSPAMPSDEQWFAHVLPLNSGRRAQAGREHHAVAAVFLRRNAPNAAPPLEAIAKRYSLVPSEVRVLAALAAIQGVKELANFLGLSQGTVKTHLHNLFRKTGTKRQSELVALIAGI